MDRRCFKVKLTAGYPLVYTVLGNNEIDAIEEAARIAGFSGLSDLYSCSILIELREIKHPYEVE